MPIITDLASGINTSPLLINLRILIELHRTVRPKLYHSIAKKILAELELNCNAVKCTQ